MTRTTILLALVAACTAPEHDECTEPTTWAAPAAPVPGAPVVIDEDGGWCWFSDERVIFVGTRLIAASTSHEGDAQVTSYDVATGERGYGVLSRRMERDDHDVASLLPLDDGRVIAFYARHDGFPTMSWRTSAPDDVSWWGPEQHFDLDDDDVSYATALWVPEEETAYLMFRGLHYNPSFVSSKDDFATWTPPAQILDAYELTVVGREFQRPYVKYAVGDGAIHLLYTDGHPAEVERTSVWHLVYQGGALGGAEAVDPADGELVHDGEADGEAWTWDAELDAEGHPVVVFSVYPDDERAADDHRYHYARWDGVRWHDTQVAFAGTALYRDERFYSGGITIDPEDPDVVYFSSNVEPTNGAATASGRFELYRGVTTDEGATWTITAVTSGSVVDNLRPIVPAHHPDPTDVVWLQGSYDSYVEVDTRVVGLFGAADVRVAEPAPLDPLVPVAGARVTFANVEEERDGLSRNSADGMSPDDKLQVRIDGLTPGAAYIVRLHGHDADDNLGLATLWFQDADELTKDRNPRFVGAQRNHGRVSGGDAALDLVLTADRDGSIELVARGLDDTIRADETAVIERVEVLARPASARLALFDLDATPGEADTPGATPLWFDTLQTDTGVARAGALTLQVWTDRLDALRRRGDDAADPAADFVFGQDELIVQLSGLEVGHVYELTVHATDLEDNTDNASRWRLEEPGRQPRIVRGFHINNRTAGPASRFTFVHVASATSLRLRAHDVLTSMSTYPSVVMLGALEVREVVEEMAR